MHDYGRYALLVGRIPVFLLASTCIEFSTHASNHQKPSFPSVSTISTYLWYFIATPLWFVHVLPVKRSKYYHLFCVSCLLETLYRQHGDTPLRHLVKTYVCGDNPWESKLIRTRCG